MAYDRSWSSSSVLLLHCGLTAVLGLGACSDDAAGDGTPSDSGGATGSTGATDDTTGELDTAATDDAEGTSSADGGSTDTGDTDGPVGVDCIDDQFVNGPSPGPDYSMFDVELGSHCQGTNQQDITEIERVVFLGDSVTVGTPPTGAPDFYRSILADALALEFGLEPPEAAWKQVNIFDGTSQVQRSGDFASCAVWGARNDDIQAQMDECFTPEDLGLRTLVVMTMGGNDLSSLAQDAIDGVPIATIFEDLEQMVAFHEEAIRWLVADPAMFPNGVFVVNTNVYEFTDYTVDLLSCPAAPTAGFNANPENPDVLLGSLNLINEEYMRIAEESGTDVVFMFEGFCGHGFHSDDPDNPCYRGPGNDNWFDFTCIHPTPAGHGALAEMFLNVVTE